ncbi:MAG: 2TM domain-containing protein [Bacteroidota bacterium]
MNTNNSIEQEREKELWKQAKRRVGFRRHLAVFIIVNGFLWAMWLFTGPRTEDRVPWPIFPMLGWGIGLAFDYYGAYMGNGVSAIEREYEKLKNKSR